MRLRKAAIVMAANGGISKRRRIGGSQCGSAAAKATGAVILRRNHAAVAKSRGPGEAGAMQRQWRRGLKALSSAREAAGGGVIESWRKSVGKPISQWRGRNGWP